MKRTNWVCVSAAVAATVSASLSAAAADLTVPKYDHIVLIIEENTGFNQVIGNSLAPNINNFANTYGLATQYFTVGDPSAPNYVAMLGGNFFGIADNNPYFTHTIDKPSLMSQLEGASLTWKGYFQSMPYAGFRGPCYPNRCNGVPDFDSLYSAKHNGLLYFKSVQTSATERAKMVPFQALTADLANPPAFMYIVPDQCHDMHGSPPYCVDSGNTGDNSFNHLVRVADDMLGQMVSQIMGAPFWSKGNNAIFITAEQGPDGDTSGCCDAVPGTGNVATIVITSHGPRGLKDPTPYNHYSLLKTFQKAFGLGCLEFTCDDVNVKAMAPLLQVK
jgi:hypothetical protein